ncbi:MAG: hypothetical protein WC661_06605 [Opitutaceae bacterium]|jgi:hypothetical protein
MKIYTSSDSIDELDSFPRSERKAIWNGAWKEMRKKEKGLWLYPLIAGLVVLLILPVLMLIPPFLVNAAIAGALAGLITQQFLIRRAIRHIKK